MKRYGNYKLQRPQLEELAVFINKLIASYGPYSRGGHSQQISYPEPRVEMSGNEFRLGKTKVFNPSGFNMAAV